MIPLPSGSIYNKFSVEKILYSQSDISDEENNCCRKRIALHIRWTRILLRMQVVFYWKFVILLWI